jgi:hypothetical protein
MISDGRKGASDSCRHLMRDRKPLIRATNTIAGILYEIRNGSGEISLQRLTTVPLEKLFGITRLHAKTHQTMTDILKAMRFVDNHKVKNRRLSDGETVAGGEWKHVLPYEPVLLSGPIWKLADFPVEYLLSDAFSRFAKAN